LIWERISLKIEGNRQSERQILIQQDMAWWSVRIVSVKDTSRIVQGANVAQSAGALDSLKLMENKIPIFLPEMINCYAYIRLESCRCNPRFSKPKMPQQGPMLASRLDQAINGRCGCESKLFSQSLFAQREGEEVIPSKGFADCGP
jgi:hypothetical protein